MKVSVLSSGSTGNSTLIETEQHKILMDAGLSEKDQGLTSSSRS